MVLMARSALPLVLGLRRIFGSSESLCSYDTCHFEDYSKYVASLPATIKWIRQMDLVDPAHQFHLPHAQGNRFIVDPGSVQIQKVALTRHWQTSPPVDHRFALVSPMRTSATDKKTFSIDDCRSSHEDPSHLEPVLASCPG